MSDNQEQIDYWNGEGGRRWVEQNRTIDEMIRPLGAATLDAAAPAAGERAIDIGCGCGNQTLALAQRIGPEGAVLAIDVSEPMLALARTQAAADSAPRAAVQYLRADAAEHFFEAGAADLLFSRFGVMFFADPVAAFANLRVALRADGRMVFCCWRAIQENELMTLPMQALLAHVPAPAPVPPDAPGPFAFANRARVLRILGDAGFHEASVKRLDCELRIGAGLGALETARRLLDLGPAARLLADAPAALRAMVERDLCAAIASRCGTDGLSITACCWLVSARA
jgi:SAM-dependent methyltransferase